MIAFWETTLSSIIRCPSEARELAFCGPRRLRESAVERRLAEDRRWWACLATLRDVKGKT